MINFVAPINETSYGITGTRLTSEMIRLGKRVNLFIIGQGNCEPEYVPDIKKALEYAQTYNPKSPCVRLFHQFDLTMFAGKGPHIGFPIFELDTLTDNECHQLYCCDQVIVCSDWARQVVLDNLYNRYKCTDFNVKIVPLGVDNFQNRAILNGRKNTIFINVGKWEVRKGHDKLVRWFNEAFTPQDAVELWLMNYNMFYTPEQNRELALEAKNTKLGDKISIIPRQSKYDDVITIMSQADCGVFPARAEGWNLEVLELMSLGKEVIATNYSGHTEFCVNSGVRLVDINKMELAHGRDGFDSMWFKGQGKWASLDNSVKEQFIQEMRKVHELKQAHILGLNRTNIETANRFSWTNSAQTLLRAICT